MIVTEKGLPKPNVHYANLYGTFLGFSDTETSDIYFCACCKSSIKNFVRIREQALPSNNSNPLRNVTFDSANFPEQVATLNLSNPSLTVEQLSFANEICHRCLQITPQKKYCAPMYGGTFKQSYGWYINQNFLRTGIDPKDVSNFLADICPAELQKFLAEHGAMQTERCNQTIKAFPKTRDVQPDLMKREAWQVKRELEKELSKNRRQVTKIIENLTREEFGFRKIGEQWVSETLLYQLVTQLYQGQEIIRNIRPVWLEGLELDIYLPNLKLAFEYQGQQHYKPVKAWGGERAFQALKQRDARKKVLCRALDISLIEFKYSEDLSLATLERKVRYV